MKKNNISGFILISAIIFSLFFLSGCNFNLSETNYLTRPDVEIKERGFQIRGPYINRDTEYINIYRQDVNTSKTERVAILFPSGNEDETDQTYSYEDKNVTKGHNYRYYLRFVTSTGEKNRTDWSEPKTAKDGLPLNLAFAYTTNDAYYKYDSKTMTLVIPDNKDFTMNSTLSQYISDIAEYKPALVFQTDDLVQVFEISSPNTTKSINLKSLLPQEFLYTDVKLLGIVGQKTVKNSKKVLKQITWSEIQAISVKDKSNKKIDVFRLEPEYGQAGFDYSIKSDND